MQVAWIIQGYNYINIWSKRKSQINAWNSSLKIISIYFLLRRRSLKKRNGKSLNCYENGNLWLFSNWIYCNLIDMTNQKFVYNFYKMHTYKWNKTLKFGYKATSKDYHKILCESVSCRRSSKISCNVNLACISFYSSVYEIKLLYWRWTTWFIYMIINAVSSFQTTH